MFPFDFIVDGEERSVQLPGMVSVSNAEAYVACCANGLGLVQLPRYHVARHLESGAFARCSARGGRGRCRYRCCTRTSASCRRACGYSSTGLRT